jgi:hypothetical protein
MPAYPLTALGRAIARGDLPIVVSLPHHHIDLARAALDAGALAIKVHLNAWHRAAGHRFGTFAEERPFLEQLATLGCPLLVMAGQETVPSEAEMDALADLGFESFNLYLRHAQPHLFKSRLRPVLALDEEGGDAEIDRIKAVPDAWMEASVMRFSDYRTPLDADDLARYRAITARVGIPVIVPSQKRFTAADMAPLKAAGLAAVLLGVVVTGETPASMAAAVAPIVRAAAAA